VAKRLSFIPENLFGIAMLVVEAGVRLLRACVAQTKQSLNGKSRLVDSQGSTAIKARRQSRIGLMPQAFACRFESELVVRFQHFSRFGRTFANVRITMLEPRDLNKYRFLVQLWI
jgi:hypothetical protein